MFDLENYCYDGSKKLNLSKVKTDSDGREKKKQDFIAKTEKNLMEINELQEKLYAESKEAVIIVLQALDAAGKDSTIKHVMASVNPQGIDVFSFKAPSADESAHDFLWRYHKCVPARGKMGIFNRSYYEEVLVVKVHELFKKYKMADRIIKDDYIEHKYKDIVAFEKYLHGNGYRIVKLFLNVSKKEQKKRFLERIDLKEKNWKLSPTDVVERGAWDKYHEAFECAINSTSSKNCPWYVLPADQKWFTRYLVSEILVRTLRDINPQFPKVSKEQVAALEESKKKLESEK